MVAGRPPKVHSDEEVVSLGKEMVDWIIEKIESGKPPVHLTQWYVLNKRISYPDWDLLRRREQFRQYYDTATDLMALSTMTNKDLEVAYGSRFLGLYSKDLRQHEKDVKFEVIDHEAQVKSEAANKNQTSPNDCLLSDLIKAVKESK